MGPPTRPPDKSLSGLTRTKQRPSSDFWSRCWSARSAPVSCGPSTSDERLAGDVIQGGVSMSTIKDRTREAVENASVRTVDMKLEVIVLPVADVERAKAFYSGLGWRLDADFSFDNGFRVVQLTPPGSAASIQFGPHMTSAAPGSVQNSYLIVSDIEAARAALAAHGVEVSDAFHAAAPGDQFRPDPRGHVSGRSSDSYSSFASFDDPD